MTPLTIYEDSNRAAPTRITAEPAADPAAVTLTIERGRVRIRGALAVRHVPGGYEIGSGTNRVFVASHDVGPIVGAITAHLERLTTA